MKTILALFLLFHITLQADFFNSEEKAALAYEKERAYYCKVFTQKAEAYAKTMRDDELAHITLESYKKRAKIYCSKEEPQKEEPQKAKQTAKPVKPKPYIKDISLEDERLCNIFQDKLQRYKQHMRQDELAYTTLESYKKRVQIFCSQETLDKKEQEVRKEDAKLCKVFQQGPILCKKFDAHYSLSPNDPLAKETLHSYQKRAEVFCSTKPLEKKDIEVYQEHKRLCKIFNDKIKSYQKEMRNDTLSRATLTSYQKRAAYFCATQNPKQH